MIHHNLGCHGKLGCDRPFFSSKLYAVRAISRIQVVGILANRGIRTANMPPVPGVPPPHPTWGNQKKIVKKKCYETKCDPNRLCCRYSYRQA
jgi:hypothetical protein